MPSQTAQTHPDLLSSPPLGILILEACCCTDGNGSCPCCCRRARSNTAKRGIYKFWILITTFLAYMCYHMSRRPLSIVKTTLAPNSNCTTPVPSVTTQTPVISYYSENNVFKSNDDTNLLSAADPCKGWAPFDDPQTSAELFGFLDSCFLFAYAIGMFFSGYIAERVHLRYFLCAGMLLSGFFTYLFGLAYYYDIHNIWWFAFAQTMSGLFQTTGWPAVVACVGHWFGSHSSRGFIFGFWNSHTNIGNILGAAIAGYFVDSNWALSFIVPGAIIGIAAVILFLFLTPYPEELNLPSSDTPPDSPPPIRRTQVIKENAYSGSLSASSGFGDVTFSQSYPSSSIRHQVNQSVVVPVSTSGPGRRKNRRTRTSEVNKSEQTNQSGNSSEDGTYEEDYYTTTTNEVRPLIRGSPEEGGNGDINPRAEVSEKKAVGFLAAFKIPGVIEFSLCLFFSKLVSYTFLYWLPYYIGSTSATSSSSAAYLSTPFDMGGIVGAVVAGIIVDRTKAAAIVCMVMLFSAIPSMFIYELYGSLSNWHNIILQLITGALVNGPYSLITTAVAADLGEKVKDNSRALATVTAIIDGTGSIGAAIGPLLASLVMSTGFTAVFYMMMIADLIALVFLIRIAQTEWTRLMATRRSPTINI